MKLLLLTDIPPCKNYTAGIVLDQLCRFLPAGSIACFAIVHPSVSPKVPEDLHSMPIQYSTKPRESALRLLPSHLGLLTAFPAELLQHYRVTTHLKRKVVDFGREQQVDAVWAVLQGQTIIRLARRVAQ